MEMEQTKGTWFWTVKFDGMFSSGEIWSPEIWEFCGPECKMWVAMWVVQIALPAAKSAK